MSSRPELRLDWCSHEAAKYAVEKWHYSHKLPLGRSLRVGAWEGGQYIGCIVFSHGANNNLLKPYGLTAHQGCELIRIALSPNHAWEVSRIGRIALSFLSKGCPGLQLVVSFADPGHSHHGGIYQAMGWVYAGKTAGDTEYFIDGQWRKQRVFRSSEWSKYSGIDYRNLTKRSTEPKHRYLMPLDDDMRKQIEPLRKPYPKRAGSAVGGTSPDQGGRGGSIPTPALSDQDPPAEVTNGKERTTQATNSGTAPKRRSVKAGS